MGSAVPYRLDLFDDEIESIRAFDVDTQRSIYPVNEIELLPGREFPFDEEARTTFRAQFREYFEGDPTRALPYKEVGDGIAFAGIEYYLPLFFTQTATLFDYLPTDSIIVTHGAVDDSIQDFFNDTLSRYEFLKHDPERPILARAPPFLTTAPSFITLQGFRLLDLRHDDAHPVFSPSLDVHVTR